ncbi:hypothetical protein D5S18_14345 [Nocardia panacis]|uniref:Polysaccharide chain length determinant N-terminal domain-containing protein n=1 Tax=Nocardia panacis TaxID=2340916 RepID=A0A3A4K8Q4_9NOCA|nr:hypothetical protein [Nocardia panacis]RJO75604.1 hypothetical protein D5S18_14345 [Nocardia panacis]
MAHTLNVLWDRIRGRRWLVAAVALATLCGAYLTAHGRATTYTSRVLVSAASTRPPTQDAILAQGYTLYLNDPTYQAKLGHQPGFPNDIASFGAEFVSASPLFFVQVTAATPAAAEDAAPKVAQLYIDDINGRLDASREATAAAMTAAMMREWGPRLTANDPNAFAAQIHLQQQIDQLNSDGSNRLTILQTGAGAAPKGAGKARTLGTGLVGGLLLGCVVAILAGAATRRLYTDYDIAEKTGVRPLEVVPPGGTAERDARRLVALRQIANLIAGSASTSVAVAPISAGEAGVQLARAIAEQRAAQGARTVFLHADLRGAERSATPGVAEFLGGTIDDVRQLCTERGAYAAIGPGAAGEDPYRLFERDRVRTLLESVGAAADLVVIAVPPIATAPEAQIVADLAGLTVLVLERGRTTVREVEAAVRAVNQVGARVLGAVLVDTSSPRPLPWRSRTAP